MEAVKSIIADLLSAGVVVGAPILGLWMGLKLMGLDKLSKVGFKIGQRLTAPVLGGARNASGRIANWGAGRGIFGRTVARLATGAVFPGGRAQMERIGESYRKGSGERRAARGSYRATPSARMSPKALTDARPEDIQRWVNNPAMASAVAALRQMVVNTPSIELSTAQRNALFSGMGVNPVTGAGLVPTGVSPTPGAPSGLAVGTLPNIDRPVGGQSAVGRWWSDRPSLAPPVRQASTPRGVLGLGGVAAHYLGGGSQQWRGWLGRGIGIVSSPAPPAPPPNPPSVWPAP